LTRAHTVCALSHRSHYAQKHGGDDDPSNLALACQHCNFHKGPNLTGIDPESGNITPLFHPRNEGWEAHFELRDVTIVGLTPVGRATVQVLNMNAAERVQLLASAPAAKQIAVEPLRVSSAVTNASLLPSTVKVKAATANLRDAPGPQGKVVATLKQGTKLSVQGEEKSWYFVQADGGKDGWISKSLTAN
jgi:hypothetical protein